MDDRELFHFSDPAPSINVNPVTINEFHPARDFSCKQIIHLETAALLELQAFGLCGYGSKDRLKIFQPGALSLASHPFVWMSIEHATFV